MMMPNNSMQRACQPAPLIFVVRSQSYVFYAFMEKNIEKDELFNKPIEFRQINKIDFGMIPQ